MPISVIYFFLNNLWFWRQLRIIDFYLCYTIMDIMFCVINKYVCIYMYVICTTWYRYLTSLSSVQSLSGVWLFATPWTAAHQASLSITNSWSLLKLMPIRSVMPSNHLILWRPLLLLPPIFPSVRVFSNESVLHIRWPKYWSFSIILVQ